MTCAECEGPLPAEPIKTPAGREVCSATCYIAARVGVTPEQLTEEES